MKIAFVKTGGPKDRMHVARADGTEATWVFPSYGPTGMPHDLVHLVVERTLGMDDGLYVRVAAGADLSRINAAANRAGGKNRDKYAALGDDLDGVLWSEALTIAAWEAEPDAVRASLVEACGKLDVAPRALTDGEIAAVRDALREARASWAALGPAEALHLDWPARV